MGMVEGRAIRRLEFDGFWNHSKPAWTLFQRENEGLQTGEPLCGSLYGVPTYKRNRISDIVASGVGNFNSKSHV
jgi:hypothetical protein